MKYGATFSQNFEHLTSQGHSLYLSWKRALFDWYAGPLSHQLQKGFRMTPAVFSEFWSNVLIKRQNRPFMPFLAHTSVVFSWVALAVIWGKHFLQPYVCSVSIWMHCTPQFHQRILTLWSRQITTNAVPFWWHTSLKTNHNYTRNNRLHHKLNYIHKLYLRLKFIFYYQYSLTLRSKFGGGAIVF